MSNDIPLCQKCKEPIWAGEAVVQQGGPHLTCPRNNTAPKHSRVDVLLIQLGTQLAVHTECKTACSLIEDIRRIIQEYDEGVW